jgi:hypothetical protein
MTCRNKTVVFGVSALSILLSATESRAGFVQRGVAKNTLVITQYTSNSGGGVRTTQGSAWARLGFTPWTVQFNTAYAEMSTNFSDWAALDVSFSMTHSVEPATQSTQTISGEVSFEVDRDHRLFLNGNFNVQVINLATGVAQFSGTILHRDTTYVLKFNQTSGGVGFESAASTAVSLDLVLPSCAGDVTENQVVDGTDLAAVLGAWGTTGLGEFITDVNADGIVGGEDLAAVLSMWGSCL